MIELQQSKAWRHTCGIVVCTPSAVQSFDSHDRHDSRKILVLTHVGSAIEQPTQDDSMVDPNPDFKLIK